MDNSHSVETLAMLREQSIMCEIVEKVAKSGEKWGKRWISRVVWVMGHGSISGLMGLVSDVFRTVRAFCGQQGAHGGSSALP